ITALLLMLVSNVFAQQRFRGAATNPHTSADELPMDFCTKRELTCVLDLTSTQSDCVFSEPILSELNKATLNDGLRLLEKHCGGYRWRLSDGIHLFEPRREKESDLGRTIRAVDLGKKVSPESFMFHLVTAADLQMMPGQGLGAKSQDKPVVRFKTSAGTLKASLISAAKQYQRTVWAIVKTKEGYHFHVEVGPEAMGWRMGGRE
ncbi:MAG: hypothetical protein NDJ72_05300, partial [Elusimicrobia bacterium]|nr:hypothetical protein [Elusimicrobiota bacterium]